MVMLFGGDRMVLCIAFPSMPECRPSQTVDNRLSELKQVGPRIGWEIVERYVDRGLSGAKGRAERPGGFPAQP
jgi:hypothetical protein